MNPIRKQAMLDVAKDVCYYCGKFGPPTIAPPGDPNLYHPPMSPCGAYKIYRRIQKEEHAGEKHERFNQP